MEATLKFDSSPKKHVGNKPFYFMAENGEDCTEHMTFVQSDLVMKSLRELGVHVVDTTLPSC